MDADALVKLAISSLTVLAGSWYVYDNYLRDKDKANEEWALQTLENMDSDSNRAEGIPMRILFGSQTGTAEGFAMELRKVAKKYGFGVRLSNLEDFELEDLEEETLVVLVVATYGEGDPTDGSEEFHSGLKEKASEKDWNLGELNFAVFGCGNRQYQFFNQMGKDYDKFLESVGGVRLVDLGLGDDDGDIEDDWEEWKQKFWEAVLPKYKGPDFVVDDTFETAFATEWLPEDTKKRLPKAQRYQCTSRNALESSRLVTVKSKRELRQDTKEGSTLHVDIDLGKSNIRYKTADNLSIVAPNDEELVDKVIQRLGLEPNALLALKRLDKYDTSPLPVPSGLSVRKLFRWQLDISSEPRKRFLRDISLFAEDEKEAEELKQMAQNGIDKSRFWNVLKVLEAFPSLKPPIHVLCELLPKQRPRAYTVSSSNRVDPRTVSVTIKLDYHKANDGTQFQGVCSKFLDVWTKPGEQLRAYITPSSFRLPRPDVPVLMIGPGTGIAPFRALIHEGNKLKQDGKELADWHLYFGCRYKESDFIYKDELLAARDDPKSCLTKLHLAFSRDGPKKVYVQDLLLENAKEVCDLVVRQKAKILVCGATSMGKGVREALFKILTTTGDEMKSETASAQLDKWLTQGRYVQELWG